MKKGRSAHTLRVLTTHASAAELRRVIATRTSAIGMREVPVTKRALERTMEAVIVGGLPVRVKVAYHDGELVNAQPEWDDVAAVAAELCLPPKQVLARAVASYWSARDAVG